MLLYAVGLIGLMMEPLQPLFVPLSPLILLISALLVTLAQPVNRAFWLFSATTILGGFFVEVAGVHTGLIFGSYSYGSTLGPQSFGVPLVIGLNWYMLTLGAGVLASRFPLPAVAKALLAAGMMTVLDIFLEPVAMELDYWEWPGDVVPLQNYLAWFFIAFAFSLLYFLLPISRENRLGGILFVIQFLFFFALNLMIHF